MKCTHATDGETCGADWAEERPAYRHGGNIKTPRTCANGHSRVTWFDGRDWRQSALGKPKGIRNKSQPIGSRYNTAFLERLKAAGWTVQEWTDYSQSLDIPAK